MGLGNKLVKFLLGKETHKQIYQLKEVSEKRGKVKEMLQRNEGDRGQDTHFEED